MACTSKGREGSEAPTYKGREVKGGREGKKGRGGERMEREMEGPTYKGGGKEGEGKKGEG